MDENRDTQKNQADETVFTEWEAKQFLRRWHVPVVAESIAEDISAAVAAAEKIGFPVVLKGLGKTLLHKTEKGLVCTNLTGRTAVEQAAAGIAERAGSGLEGFLVAPQVAGKRELVAGVFTDKQYGPVIMFGLGGVFTEVLSDVSFRLLPLSRSDALHMIEDIRYVKILEAFRGEQAADKEALVDILVNLSAMVMENPDIREVDINPLIITPRGEPVAVDALIIKGARKKEESYLPPVEPGIVGSFFYPKSVAFVGASARLGKWGYTLLTNTFGGGFAGDVYLVNPRGGEIAGRPVYPSLTDIPGRVDMAVVTIPARKVFDLIPEMAAKNISSMLLIASGFGETGEEGLRLEQALVEKAREAGIFIIGPNTMGICNPHVDFYCTGMHVRPAAGSVGAVAQSGNIGVQLLGFAELQGIGIRGFCGSGNEAMITMEDYLEAFEVDPLTETVMLYVESVKNGRRFYESARRVGRKKPVVLLKGGQTEAGSRAASSHTGAMASDTRVFNAVCRQAGIVKVEKPMDLLDLSAAFSALPLPEGNRVGIMTLGGGWGVVTSDLCEHYHLAVPELSAELIGAIDQILPPFWSRANPVDLVGENDPDIPLFVMEELMKWDGCDAVINLGIVGRRHMLSRMADSIRKADPETPASFMEMVLEKLDDFEEKYMKHLVSLMEKYKKPVLGVNILRGEKDRTVYSFEGARHKAVFFPTPEQAVRSLARMYEYRRFLQREEAEAM